jgi:hypothetical protein
MQGLTPGVALAGYVVDAKLGRGGMPVAMWEAECA